MELDQTELEQKLADKEEIVLALCLDLIVAVLVVVAVVAAVEEENKQNKINANLAQLGEAKSSNLL